MVDRKRKLRVNPVRFREHVLMALFNTSRDAAELVDYLKRSSVPIPLPIRMGPITWMKLFLRKQAKAGLVTMNLRTCCWSLTGPGRDLAGAALEATRRMP